MLTFTRQISKFMPYFAYNVGGWVQKEGKMCLRNKSMAPKVLIQNFIWILDKAVTNYFCMTI